LSQKRGVVTTSTGKMHSPGKRFLAERGVTSIRLEKRRLGGRRESSRSPTSSLRGGAPKEVAEKGQEKT